MKGIKVIDIQELRINQVRLNVLLLAVFSLLALTYATPSYAHGVRNQQVKHYYNDNANLRNRSLVTNRSFFFNNFFNNPYFLRRTHRYDRFSNFRNNRFRNTRFKNKRFRNNRFRNRGSIRSRFGTSIYR